MKKSNKIILSCLGLLLMIGLVFGFDTTLSDNISDFFKVNATEDLAINNTEITANNSDMFIGGSEIVIKADLDIYLNNGTGEDVIFRNVSANIQADRVKAPASDCPGNSAITGFEDNLSVVTCQDLWINEAGDNMTTDSKFNWTGSNMTDVELLQLTLIGGTPDLANVIYVNSSDNKLYYHNGTDVTVLS